MKKRRRGQVLLTYPDIYDLKGMMQALKEERSVKEEAGAVAYRVVKFKPKWRTEKVTFYTGLGWLSDNELFQLRQSDSRMAP